MVKNITIEGFELSITARVLCDRLIDRKNRCYRETFDYRELLTQGVYSANDLLKEFNLSSEIWVRLSGKKAFVFCEHSHRILAELAIDADNTRFGLKRPRFVLLDRKGLTKCKTIADLLIKSEKLRRYQKFKNRQNNNRIQYIEKAKQFNSKKGVNQ